MVVLSAKKPFCFQVRNPFLPLQCYRERGRLRRKTEGKWQLAQQVRCDYSPGEVCWIGERLPHDLSGGGGVSYSNNC